MDRTEQDLLFRRGLSMMRKGRLHEAAMVFDRVRASGTEEPLHLSYCGLLTAKVGGDRRAGLKLCEQALRFGSHEPEVVINLAQVYECTGARTRAVKLLRFGLRNTPKHPGMVALIDRLSPRSQPPLTVVDRNNPVNKFLGIMLARAAKRLRGAGGRVRTA